MKILLAIDSFKGSLTSSEAEEAVEDALRTSLYCNSLEIISFPMADGGEGLLESLMSSCGAKPVSAVVHNPLMERIEAQYAISASRMAFIEMARTSGLTLISEERRNPMLTTTYGLGEIISHAMANGCREFVIGIGGSATNDAGCGMLQALGYRFFCGKEEMDAPMCGGMLKDITGIDISQRNPLLDHVHITVACDVRNPLFGANGAAYIYAPQKGANGDMVRALDEGLEHFSNIVEKLSPGWGGNNKGAGMALAEGAGAAGGIGYAFAAILGADLVPGAETVLRATGFYDALSGCDYVITGEGKLDSQTSNGKLPQCILNAVREHGIPVVAIAGKVECANGYMAALEITPAGMPLETAMLKDVACANIKDAIKKNISIFA